MASPETVSGEIWGEVSKKEIGIKIKLDGHQKQIKQASNKILRIFLKSYENTTQAGINNDY